MTRRSGVLRSRGTLRAPPPVLRFAWSALAALMSAAASCGSDGPSVPVSGPAIRFVSGSGTTDTVTGSPATALVVRVTGPDGRPMSGVLVNASVTPGQVGPFERGASIRVDGGGVGGPSLSDTTRANGELAIRLTFGTRAGTYKIFAQAPRLVRIDSATATAVPASPAHVVVSEPDTTAYIG